MRDAELLLACLCVPLHVDSSTCHLSSACGDSGDPFTRLLRPGRQATAFENTTEGQIQAIGLQVSSAPGNRLQVGIVLNGSPAQAAGVHAGDEILEINGVDIHSKTKE